MIRKKVLEYLAYGFVILLVVLLVLSVVKQGIYARDIGLNLIVVGNDSASIALVRPNEDHITWVRLPSVMQVKIDGTEAVYPVYSLWKFASTEKRPFDVVIKSISNTLGVVLSSVVVVDGSANPENLLSSMNKLVLKSNLSFRDRLLLRQDLANLISYRKVLEIELPRTALTKKVDPDGFESFEVNQVVNLWTKNRFVFETLLGENVEVSVHNLSGVPGAGLSLSRKLEASGLRVGEVVSKYDNPPKGKGCLFASTDQNKKTIYLLKKYFGCQKIQFENLDSEDRVKIWLI